jgi:hypothetical protein
MPSCEPSRSAQVSSIVAPQCPVVKGRPRMATGPMLVGERGVTKGMEDERCRDACALDGWDFSRQSAR